MSAAMIRRVLPLLSIPIALYGCATPLPPVVKESLKCEIPSSMLERCAPPTQIQEGVTYEQMISDVGRQDRENLRICAQRHDSLAGVASICQAEIAKYNQEVREANARNAKEK